ncbi:hypothetical protein Tco_1491946 [Tanacetum coccineum]
MSIESQHEWKVDEELSIPEQMATGKGTSNPLMAGCKDPFNLSGPSSSLIPLEGPDKLNGSLQPIKDDSQDGSYGLQDLDAYSVRTILHGDSLPKKEKDPRRLGKLAHTKLTVELADRTVKHPKGIAKNVLVWIEPTVKDGKIVNEPMMEIVKTMCDFIGGLDDFPSDCDFDRRIHINCAYNLRFSCMTGFEYVHANFLPILPISVMSKKFYNSIMKDKIEFKGMNELGNFVNTLVFIQNFYVITDFTVVEDMDPYLDEWMGDVIVGEPFCKASCVEAKRFDGMITISDCDDIVTYQMVRSNPKFKHLTNEKCNNIPPLLKVSEQDKMNGISHSYQKLKGFYKGVLNLGTEFIQDAKVEEWLTREHISVHEME